MKAKVYLRADGSSQIGLGHIYRSLAVAEMIKDKFECTFGIRDSSGMINALFSNHDFALVSLPSRLTYSAEAEHLSSSLKGYDIIVLDGYAFDTDYQQLLRDAGIKVVCIDDTAPYHFVSDCVINHGPASNRLNYSCEQYTQLYLGPQYALLREPFASSKPKFRIAKSFKKMFISFGGSDPNNFTLKSLVAAWSMATFESITIVTGTAYQYIEKLRHFASDKSGIQLLSNVNAHVLYQEMVKADIAIVPSSTMLFELLTTGTLALTGYYVDNQKHIYEGFEEQGVLIGIGNLNDYTIDALADRINQELANKQKISAICKRSTEVFDGNTRQRIKGIFEFLMRK